MLIIMNVYFIAILSLYCPTVKMFDQQMSKTPDLINMIRACGYSFKISSRMIPEFYAESGCEVNFIMYHRIFYHGFNEDSKCRCVTRLRNGGKPCTKQE